jgi:hypothetical protein
LAVGLATVSAPAAVVAAGLIWALALSVKLTAVTALPPLLWFARHRLKQLLLGGLVGGAAIVALHVTALGPLWSSNVRYHELARSTPEVIPHPYRQILDQMPRATPFPWLVLVAAVIAVMLAIVGWRRELWPLWTWALLSVAFLFVHQPLHYNHLLIVPATLAVATGATFATVVPRHRIVTLLLAVVLVGAFVQQWRRVGSARDVEPTTNTAAAAALARLTPPNAPTVDDRPIISFLAHRRVVGSLVDLAALRFETGSLRDEDVIRGLDGARAVVISRTLRDHPRVLRAVHARFHRRYDHGGVQIWVRSS